MTREEALAYAISQKAGVESELHRTPCGYGNWAVYSTVLDFINAAISALKGPTREQVEKVWRGEWEVDEFGHKCSKCGEYLPSGDDDIFPQFCPNCGDAKTEEAVETIMKRMEEMRND